MDWETAMECWLAVANNRYAAEAVEILAEEVAQSGDLRADDKAILGQLVEEIRRTGRYGVSEEVEGIIEVLFRYDGFRAQIVRVAAERLSGKQ